MKIPFKVNLSDQMSARFISMLIIVLFLPFVLTVTSQQCKNVCRTEYGSNIGGRIATNNDKGAYGFNDASIDCTCVFPWKSFKNERSCDNYCNSRNDVYNYCYYVNRLCFLHVGVIY